MTKVWSQNDIFRRHGDQTSRKIEPWYLSQTRTWNSNIICSGLFCVQWVKVRGDCSFCWYWLNCWPSLLKLSFHNLVAQQRFLGSSNWYFTWNIQILGDRYTIVWNFQWPRPHLSASYSTRPLLNLIPELTFEWVSEWLLFNANLAIFKLYIMARTS